MVYCVVYQRILRRQSCPINTVLDDACSVSPHGDTLLHAANCERRPPPYPVGGDQAVAANHDPFRFAGEVGLHDINLGARQVDTDPNPASSRSQKTTSLSSTERPSTVRLVIRRSRNLTIRRLSQQRPRVERSTEAWERVGPHPGAIDMGGAAPPLFS